MHPIYEINRLQDKLPLHVVQDLHKRIADWLASGGEYDDPYMHQQVRYAQEVAYGNERGTARATFTHGGESTGRSITRDQAVE